MVDALRGAPDSAADLLVLDQLPRVGPVTIRKLVTRFGSARRALRAPASAFAAVAGREAASMRSEPSLRRRADAALTRAGAMDVDVLTWSDDQYPVALLPLADPPPVLFIRGRRELLDRGPLVTIVGARRATDRALGVSERLATSLVRAGVTVASGLALGVDGAAHAGALDAGGATVAVLGTGPDVAYPRAHQRLFRRIVADGLVVSEFMPGTKAAPHHFPRRNRILAALSSTTVVVEAGRKSGSLITVDHALDLGRDVWAVPGPIDTAASAGSNRLLVDGATPLISIEAFVASITGEARPEPSSHDPDAPGFTGVEDRVLEALAEEPLLADEVSDRCRLPVHEVLALLTTLELHGEVVRLPGMRFRRAA